MTTTEKIIAWFEENEDTFCECIEELDSWDGYLGDDRYYDMYELDEIYHDSDPSEILARAFYGYDENDCIIDKWGEKHKGNFNPNRDYFRFNGYGNLVSTDYKDYSDHLDSYFVDALQRNRCHIDTIDENDELSALFDELDNESAA